MSSLLSFADEIMFSTIIRIVNDFFIIEIISALYIFNNEIDKKKTVYTPSTYGP